MYIPLTAPLKFQSTLPARGSDIVAPKIRSLEAVSIHAPREGERLSTARMGRAM